MTQITKNIDSKLSETQTESDITAKTTKIDKMPQNINLSVVVPSLTQRVELESAQSVKEESNEKDLALKKSDLSEVVR